uniref:CD248 molecule, endosialin a n=1 Tax=Mola mola TaxID=94237 RepID=A0A3Q3VMX7_MOLML
MLIFLLLLLNGSVGVSGGEKETICTSNACFTLNMDRGSFEKAQQSCVHNGGYLMTVRDREEEDVLRSLLSQIQRQHQHRTLKFWIGLKLHRGDCVLTDKILRGFKWVSGEGESHYSNWEKEPISTCTENRCVKVHYTLSGENHLKWTSGPCKSSIFYVCEFYFKGMCRPLALLGPGQIAYTAPFSEEPTHNEMQLFPMGTYAEILCSDQQSHDSVCMGADNAYRWNVPGPFCKAGKQNCAINNGGCEHLCHQDADESEVQCSCKEGYKLEEDGLACRIQDLCRVDTCEHQCVMGDTGYSCKCPHGLKLDANQHNCSDIDECRSQACEHHCINTHGSYTCACRDGYQMVDGRCSDIDECVQLRCEHGCSNSIGSFSCHCNQGFTLSEDGHSCGDVNECINSGCQFKCVNTEGSFFCACPQGFHIDTNGWICARDGASPALPVDPAEEEIHKSVTESLTRTTVELQHQSPHTETPLPDLINNTQGKTSATASFTKMVTSRVLICVLGSVIPLLLLVAVTLAIFRRSHTKKDAKKNTTTEGYCWVSPGLDPRLFVLEVTA